MAVTTLECTSHYLRAAILQAVCLTFMTFAGLIAIWCILGFYMGNHPVVRRIVDRYGHILVPFVLIGLGIYILLSTR